MKPILIRSWFYIHINTLLMLLLPGSLLIWANVGWNYPDSGWPMRHGLFSSYYVHGWITISVLDAIISVVAFIFCGVVFEFWVRSNLTEPSFGLKSFAIRGAATCMVCAVVCMGLSIIILKLTNPYGWDSNFRTLKIIRGQLVTLPIVGLIGAFIGWCAYREINDLHSPLWPSEKGIFFPSFSYWYPSACLLGFGQLATLPVALLFLPIFISYYYKRKEVARGGHIGTYFILLAFLFCLFGFLGFYLQRRLSGLHEKLGGCAYCSLWMGEATMTALVSRWRAKNWIAKPNSDTFQFSLGTLLVLMLLIGAYVCLLIKLFEPYHLPASF